ncbi:MAG: methionine ABC transporter ATP-binding protein [Rhodospirillaceae bacterium]|nr:methionine ABC transporter ATP-binding protein [Rhodospirillaceae bacterium]
MGAAVNLSDIVFRWRKSGPVVLNIPSLSVATGEKAFVSGPSGSGKTTLLNVLGCVAVPEEGRATVLGESIGELSAARRDSFRADRIGIIFQQFNLIPYLSVLDNVLLPCRFSGLRRQNAGGAAPQIAARARDILARLELPVETLIDRPATSLSVGQQQRVAAARALIGSPDLVIADEPTSSLDEDARKSFIDLLFREIQKNNQTLIFVSHDRRLEGMFDRTVALDRVNRVSPTGISA